MWDENYNMNQRWRESHMGVACIWTHYQIVDCNGADLTVTEIRKCRYISAFPAVQVESTLWDWKHLQLQFSKGISWATRVRFLALFVVIWWPSFPHGYVHTTATYFLVIWGTVEDNLIIEDVALVEVELFWSWRWPEISNLFHNEPFLTVP